jgi:copper chaperone NosL
MPRRVLVGRGLGTVLALAAAVLLIVAVRKPYWEMTLHAPQYPMGLHLKVYLDRVVGDTDEINELNHYIGVASIEEGAKLERAIGVPAIVILAGALVLAPFAGKRKFALLAIPALGFPAGFVLDLLYWMNRLSTHLDPHAAIKMKPFHFALSGTSKIAQFSSDTQFTIGFAIAVLAALLALAAIGLREVVACRSCPHHDDCGIVCKGVLPWPARR